MRIGVVGLGYVGLVTAAVLASIVYSVARVDVDVSRIHMLRYRRTQIFKPELEEKIRKTRDNLEFSTDYSKLSNCEVIFLCVLTPNMGNRIDLKYVLVAASEVNKYSFFLSYS